MAAQTALRGERVIYIDTDGSFSGKRFAAMHERLSGGAAGADCVASLRCVELFRVFDLHSLLELLSALQSKLEVCRQPSQDGLSETLDLKGYADRTRNIDDCIRDDLMPDVDFSVASSWCQEGKDNNINGIVAWWLVGGAVRAADGAAGDRLAVICGGAHAEQRRGDWPCSDDLPGARR